MSESGDAATKLSPDSTGTGALRTLTTAGQILLGWLAALPGRLVDWLFAMNDTEAYWRDWQIIKTRGGLGRRYRDPRFDLLATCPRSRGQDDNAGPEEPSFHSGLGHHWPFS